MGKDLADGHLPADAADQVRCAFANLEAILAAAGAGPADVARLTVLAEVRTGVRHLADEFPLYL